MMRTEYLSLILIMFLLSPTIMNEMCLQGYDYKDYTHSLTCHLKRARAPLLAATVKVSFARGLCFGGELTIAWACPCGLEAGTLAGAAGQVIV